jgi:type I restriction enzyme M protein
MAKRRNANQNSGANLGFEEKLWAAADKLRGHMDAAEYKHVVLGLVFQGDLAERGSPRRCRLAYPRKR